MSIEDIEDMLLLGEEKLTYEEINQVRLPDPVRLNNNLAKCIRIFNNLQYYIGRWSSVNQEHRWLQPWDYTGIVDPTRSLLFYHNYILNPGQYKEGFLYCLAVFVGLAQKIVNKYNHLQGKSPLSSDKININDQITKALNFCTKEKNIKIYAKLIKMATRKSDDSKKTLKGKDSLTMFKNFNSHTDTLLIYLPLLVLELSKLRLYIISRRRFNDDISKNILDQDSEKSEHYITCDKSQFPDMDEMIDAYTRIQPLSTTPKTGTHFLCETCRHTLEADEEPRTTTPLSIGRLL